MGSSERPMAAFALAVVSGLLILLVSGFAIAMWAWVAPMWGGMGMMGGMMGGWMGFLLIGPVIGVISGIAVLVGAVMLYNNPGQSQTWGIIILVFSVLSLLGGGGFLVGAILGIVSGILALTWRP